MGKQCHLRYIQTQFFQTFHLRKDFPGIPLHDNPTLIHHKHMIRENNFFHIMCDQNDCHAFLLIQFPNCLQHFFSSIWVQHRRRFIQDDTLRMHRHNSGNRHTLFLTSGKFIGRMMTIRHHTYRFQTFIHPLPDILRGNTHIFRTESHIFFHDRSYDLVVGVLEYHPRFLTNLPDIFLLGSIHIIHPKRPFRGNKKTIQVLGKRGFSASVMSQNRDKLSGLNIQIHIVNRTVDFRFLAFFRILKIIKTQLCRSNNSHYRIPLLIPRSPPCPAWFPQKMG